MNRVRNRLVLALLCCSAAHLVAQEVPSPGPAASYETLIAANYRPLDAVRHNRAAMPRELSRMITLTRRGVLLQQILLDIANQAGFGLSYGEDLARSRTLVSIAVNDVTAADALTAAVQGTGWTVFVNPAAQVTVVKAAIRRMGVITGRVTDVKRGERLPGVEVFLERTQWRTTTDTSGRYRLVDIDSGSYTLTVRRVGYRKESRKVVVQPEREDTVDLALESVAVPLDELVTTATGQQRRRDLGNAITTIQADSVLRSAPIRNLTDLLTNRVPGLTVQHTSGAPGDPARLRLRGVGSLLRSNDPVVVVDGVRVYAAQSEARSGNLTNGIYVPGTLANQVKTPAPSPLDQIDPNIIDKIEVFKGPSAATLYGADAANGVIVITTKHGKPGPTRWSAAFEYGRTRTLGRYPTGYYRWGHDSMLGISKFCAVTDIHCVQDSLVQLQVLNEPALTPLGQGHRSAVSLTGSGGSQSLTYSVTGTYSDELGLLQLPQFEVERFRTTFNREAPDWMRRPHQLTSWSVTSNVVARLSPTADVTLSSSLSRSEQQRTSLEDQLAAMAGTYVDTINKVYYRPSIDFPFSPPPVAILQDYYVRSTASAITFTTGLTATWRPRSWFNTTARAGLNLVPRSDQRLLPSGLVSPTDSGYVSRATGQALTSTIDLLGTIRRPLKWGFVFEANLGANLKTESTTDVGAAASGLVPGTSSLTGATRLSAFDQQASNSVFGWYLEPRISGQRLSLSTGLRLDGGSTYGTRISGLGNLLALPKLNGSWVISEEPWFPLGSLFSSLRLRGAYGQAQVQPDPTARPRLYQYSGQVKPTVKLTSLGNTQLRPERSTEVEGGFDADLVDSRLSLELTAYRKTQVDALMPMQLPGSVNGGGSVLTNIGTVRNTGLELVLRMAPVRSPALSWSNELAYSCNHNKLVELGRGVLPSPSIGFVEGYPIGSRWERPILGYSDRNGDGVLQPTEIVVGDSAVFMGAVYPAYQLTLQSGITLFNGAVGITGGLSYDAGATQLDETAKTNWMLSRVLVDLSTPLSQQAAALTSSDISPYPHTKYGVIQEVSTFRFRSLAVRYRAPAAVRRLVRAQQLDIALQGDNLAFRSSYRGKDPDVNTWDPTARERVVDTGQLTRPTTWQLRIDVQY